MPEKIQKIDSKIFKKFGVGLAYLFGSRVKGTASKKSDFDVAVLFAGAGGQLYCIDKALSLEASLADFFPAKLNVVPLNHTNNLLKFEVIKYGRLLYCKNQFERIKFEVATIKNYIDEGPLRRFYDKALHRKILQGA